MRKFLALALAFAFSVWTGGFSYAQNCPACDTAPKELQQYIDIMNSSIAKLLYTPKQQVSDASISNVIQATKNSLNQYQVMLAIGEILFSAPGDVFGDIKVLWRSAEQKRDRDLLLKVDDMLTNEVMTMISRDGLLTKVTPEKAAALDAVLQKIGNGMLYLNKDKDGSYSLVNQQKTNADLAQFLRGLNMTVKKLHRERRYTRFLFDQGKNLDITSENAAQAYSGEIAKQTELMKKVVASVETWRDTMAREIVTSNGQRSYQQEWVHLSTTGAVLRIWQIESQYQCADGLTNKCGKLQTIRKENWKLAKDTIVNDSTKSWNTIKEAAIRLAQFIAQSGGKDAQEKIQQRKRALLQSYWGTDVDRRLDNGYVNRGIEAVGSLWRKISKAEQKSQDPANYNNPDELFGSMTITNLKETIGKPDLQPYKDMAAKAKFIKEVYKEAKEKAPVDTLFDDTTFKDQANARVEVISRSKDYLKESIKSSLHLQQQLQEQAVYNEVYRVTREFPNLSRKVYETIRTIGLKNQKGEKNEGTLVNSMGHVCDLQCTNTQGKCWYIED